MGVHRVFVPLLSKKQLNFLSAIFYLPSPSARVLHCWLELLSSQGHSDWLWEAYGISEASESTNGRFYPLVQDTDFIPHNLYVLFHLKRNGADA